MDLQRVFQTIEENRAEMVSSLSALISIPSVAVRTEGRQPFGAPVQQAFEHMLGMAEREGMPTWNADNFGGHIDLPGRGNGIFGIVGHLDVVPEGDGWDFDPYGGEVIDGFVCGRGATDDKGPVVASFYAMKALKDCGYIPDRTVRLILGLDEETNWEGMQHYLAFAEKTPDLGFTPDGDFPVIHGEMGILIFDLARKFGRSGGKGLELRSFTGGTAANCVADRARAVVLDTAGAGYSKIREMLKEIREERGWNIRSKGIGKSLEITAEGTAAHGARPDQGLNAISMLMEVLGSLHFVNDEAAQFIRFYNEHIGFDLHGEKMGCALEDEASGRLIWNTGMIDMDQRSVRLTINVRYPVTADAEQVYSGITDTVSPYDIGIIKGRHQLPIYISSDDPMIGTMMEIYRKHTGDTDSQPLVIGGGTYARAMDHIVAFGARFPGEPELCHQRNEKLSIDALVKLAKIYAETIFTLAGEAPEQRQAAPQQESPQQDTSADATDAPDKAEDAADVSENAEDAAPAE